MKANFDGIRVKRLSLSTTVNIIGSKGGYSEKTHQSNTFNTSRSKSPYIYTRKFKNNGTDAFNY